MCCSETSAEQSEFASERRDEYFRMKAQWTSVSPKQLSRNKHLQEQINRRVSCGE